jgi:hypothetical protein
MISIHPLVSLSAFSFIIDFPLHSKGSRSVITVEEWKRKEETDSVSVVDIGLDTDQQLYYLSVSVMSCELDWSTPILQQ